MAVYERNQVHQACRSLESVVNIYADYCQAVGAAMQFEKRLAKSLREAASCAAVTEAAGAHCIVKLSK